MNDVDQLKDTPFEHPRSVKRLPGMLNVLTILTFIGCGIGYLSSIYDFFVGSKKNLQKLEDIQGTDEFEKMPGFVKKMMGPEALEMAQKAYENRVSLFILNLVAITLCLYGAIQMRKFKKQGFYLWLLGELLPLVAIAIFVGMGFLTGFTGMIIFCFVALFIILYATQVKHLK